MTQPLQHCLRGLETGEPAVSRESRLVEEESRPRGIGKEVGVPAVEIARVRVVRLDHRELAPVDIRVGVGHRELPRNDRHLGVADPVEDLRGNVVAGSQICPGGFDEVIAIRAGPRQ
jgi:hypothetical protein